jgi:hypothetical protein
LDDLLEDTTLALNTLAGLSESFKSVETQTTAFQGQCEDLLEEQRHLKSLADEIGTYLQYYSYLEPITRRLNAPGASSMIGDDGFVEMLTTLDSCIKFMIEHVGHYFIITCFIISFALKAVVWVCIFAYLVAQPQFRLAISPSL